MPAEWKSSCKDCGKEFGYSDSSHRASITRGMSRPERCPSCRRLHSREIASVGMSHYELQPIVPLPDQALPQGTLGGLRRAPRKLIQVQQEASFDLTKFGIKDEHMREYCALAMSQRHQVMVVVAPTGSGKSTFFPYRLMVPPAGRPEDKQFAGLSVKEIPADLFTRYGQIIVTQPRTQATRNIPAFVAEQLHGSTLGAGFDVGYQHSGNVATDWRNKLVYMTDGTLINIIVRNELHRVGVIVIDEAHERSINIDLILGLLKRQLPLYPHLRVVIASATIDSSLFMRYFGAPADFNPDAFKSVNADGDTYDNKQIMNMLAQSPVGFYGFPGKRPFPVETRFWDGEEVPVKQFSLQMPNMVAEKVVNILLDMQSNREKQRGDILAFLPGKAPIEKSVALIREFLETRHEVLSRKVDVLPLYTELPQAEQDKALKPKKDRTRYRVVVSTNVAETSLTVDGIVHVVDSGLINEAQWNSESQTTTVLPILHSQAGCKQRWGRGGRVQAGVAHCLYTKSQFETQFPAHTLPEIVRKPIDQIVLTAKAAGIRDLKQFDWIQRPAEIELERAPHYLAQIGALDSDGDLTEHGNELRNFADDTDVANLMVLADRFGCAVEMAILLTMRKLGGYLAFFEWHRDWDIYVKHDVAQIHQGLFATCVDDVEFYIKLWLCWSNATDKKLWCERHFVRHEVLKNVLKDSDTLLQGLMSKTKFEKVRAVDSALLTRVRILITYGLPNQIYHLVTVDGDTEYRPEPTVAIATHVQAMHANAKVNIDPASICYGRQIPLFVCGSRKQRIKRESPITEPKAYITTSFISQVQPVWLQCVGMSHMQLARFIAKHTRQQNGTLPKLADARLFVDQQIPIGSIITGDVQMDGRVVATQYTKNTLPAPVTIRWNNQDIVVVDDIEEVTASGALADVPSVEILDEDGDEITIDELDVLSTDFDTYEQPTNHTSPSATQSAKHAVRVKHTLITQQTNVRTQVVGYTVTSANEPVVLVSILPEQTMLNDFARSFHVGYQANVQLLEVCEFAAERTEYVLTRHQQSGLEIILEAADCIFSSIAGVNALREAPIGTEFLVDIQEVDVTAKKLRVSRLSTYEKYVEKFRNQLTTPTKMPDGTEQLNNVFTGLIVEVNDKGMNVWIDFAKTMHYLPFVGFAHVKTLPMRPSEMLIGRTCRVKITPRDMNKRPIEVPMSVVDMNQAEKQQFMDAVRPYWHNDKLVTKKPISYEQWRKLTQSTQNPYVLRKIGRLFRESHQFYAEVIDMVGLQHINNCLIEGKPVQARINEVHNNGVSIVTDEGYSTFIFQNLATYNTRQPLIRQFSRGTPVTVFVNQLDIDRGEAKLTLRDPAKHPFLRYTVGTTVSGIVKFNPDYPQSVHIEIADDVTARLYLVEASTRYVVDFADAGIMPNQRINVVIVNIVVDKELMIVSVRKLYEPEYRKFVRGQKYPATLVHYDDTWATFELAPHVYGSMHINEATSLRKIERFAETGWRPEMSKQVVVTKPHEDDYKIRISAQKAERIAEFDLSALNKSLFQVVRSILSDKLQKIECRFYFDYNTQLLTIRTANEATEKLVTLTIQSTEAYQAHYATGSARFIIGPSGATVKRLNDAHNVRINVDNDEISIYADSRNKVESALREALTIASSKIFTSPTINTVRPLTRVVCTVIPFKAEVGESRTTTTILYRPSVVNNPVVPTQKNSSQETVRMQVTAEHLKRLQKAPGLFSFMSKPPIARIEAETGASITVMPNNLLMLTGSATAVANARNKINEVK